MSTAKKILLVYVGAGADDPGDGLDARRLAGALRARGGAVEELELGDDPVALLERLEAGAVPVVFDGGRSASR